jgi:hypothetical protein
VPILEPAAARAAHAAAADVPIGSDRSNRADPLALAAQTRLRKSEVERPKAALGYAIGRLIEIVKKPHRQASAALASSTPAATRKKVWYLCLASDPGSAASAAPRDFGVARTLRVSGARRCTTSISWRALSRSSSPTNSAAEIRWAGAYPGAALVARRAHYSPSAMGLSTLLRGELRQGTEGL